MTLQGSSVIVTGAGYGIGRACALGIAKAGGDLVAADIDVEAAERTAEEARGLGVDAIVSQVDVSDAGSVTGMVDTALKNFPDLDSIANIAGTWLRPVTVGFKPIETVSVDEWDWVMAVNGRGVFNCCKALVPHLKQRGGGGIVNMVSATVFLGTEGLVQYVAAKGAVLGFSRSLARELGPSKIRVNTVSPGLIQTEDHPSDEVVKHHRRVAELGSLGRIGYPEDIAGAVVFFLSTASEHITGQTMLIDGGTMLH